MGHGLEAAGNSSAVTDLRGGGVGMWGQRTDLKGGAGFILLNQIYKRIHYGRRLQLPAQVSKSNHVEPRAIQFDL